MKLEAPEALSFQEARSRRSGRAENKEPIKVCLPLKKRLSLWEVTYGRHRRPRNPRRTGRFQNSLCLCISGVA